MQWVALKEINPKFRETAFLIMDNKPLWTLPMRYYLYHMGEENNLPSALREIINLAKAVCYANTLWEDSSRHGKSFLPLTRCEIPIEYCLPIWPLYGLPICLTIWDSHHPSKRHMWFWFRSLFQKERQYMYKRIILLHTRKWTQHCKSTIIPI